MTRRLLNLHFFFVQGVPHVLRKVDSITDNIVSNLALIKEGQGDAVNDQLKTEYRDQIFKPRKQKKSRILQDKAIKIYASFIF